MRELEPTLMQLAYYASAIADGAQMRRLQLANGEDVKLYDDDWWQPVMDYVRTELHRLAHEAKAKEKAPTHD